MTWNQFKNWVDSEILKQGYNGDIKIYSIDVDSAWIDDTSEIDADVIERDDQDMLTIS